MKKWLFVVITLLSGNLLAAPESSLQQALDKQLKPLFLHHQPNALWGMVVMDTDTGHVLYDYNGFSPFTPASIVKLFSTASGLFQLGSNFRYHTQLHSSKPPKKGKIHHLYVKFSGDPSLTIADMTALLSQLNGKGIKKITGNIILDTSVFSDKPVGPGWSQDDLAWYYAAPISSIMLNENAVGVNVSPNNTLDKPTKISLSGEALANYITLSSNVTTTTFENAMKHCTLNVSMNALNHLTMTGCWPVNAKHNYLKVAIKNPTRIAEQLIEKTLKDHRITLKGKILVDKKPKDGTTLLAEHVSQPLSVLIHTTLKDSNNVYAEAITKTLGAHSPYHQGSFLEGSNRIKKLLTDNANIDFSSSRLVDGSGASRYDALSPRQIARLLYVMHHIPSLSAQFQNALPESGTNGTLRHRMKSFDLQGHIFAKTGSLKGVSNLAGYMVTANHRKLVFVIMMNNLTGKVDEARMLQAKIASLLYKL